MRTEEDPSMSAATHSGLQLGDFLSRPVKIGQFTWTSSGTTITEINPWDEFLSNPTVARKIANFKLLKGNLHVKAVINGSPFLYGKLMMNYHPLYSKDNFAPANAQSRLCRLSQRQRIYMNPTTSSGGEMILPFFWQYNAVHVPLQEWAQLGRMTFIPISTLKHAAGETPSCTVTLFAWMPDAQVMQPTSTTYAGQMGEANRKVVSKTATAVGKIAGMASSIPVIGPYARATEEVANRIGRVADIFGYSKPRGTHDIMDTRQRHVGSLATVNDKDMARTLTLDVKNEVTVDPRTVGLSGEDEMTIPGICCKEALITRFSWDISDTPDTELLRIPVTPYIRSTFSTDSKTDLPPCAYLAQFFRYWRGTMNYRFMVNASNFHRGKLRFRFEPYGIQDGQDYNVVQSEIVDLAEVHDHAIGVGWGSDRNFLQVTNNGIAPTIPNGNLDLLAHNGVIVVSVANNLTVPDETSETSIEILLAVSTDEDIQFSVPTEEVVTRTRIIADVTDLDDPVANDPEDPQIPTGLSYPQPTKTFGGLKCGVFYYGWHTNDFHNNQGYLRDQLVPRQYPAVPGISVDEYDDRSRTVVRAQFDTMLKAGIDYCVCSWGGLGSGPDQQFADAAFLEAGTVASGTMFVSLLYEMNKLRNLPSTGGQRIWTSEVRDTITTDFTHAKINYFQSNKYLKRNLQDGSQTSCPVVFLYLLRAYTDTDKALILQTIINVCQDSSIGGYTTYPYIIGDLMFGTPRAFGGSVTSRLGALGAYDVGGQIKDGDNKVSNQVIIDMCNRYGQWKSLNPSIHIVPTISPGYNDKAVRAGNNVLPRALAGYDEGSLFKSFLTNLEGTAITTNNQWFLINSWNEWHEDSQIEPCQGGSPTADPPALTKGVVYEAYDTDYVNIVGNFMVSGYVAQSEERENEHQPESVVTETLLDVQDTYTYDDSVFFGERIASIRTMLKRYTKYAVNETDEDIRSSYRFPNFPHYKWNGPSSTLHETLLTRLSVLFLGRRGATRWKAIPDFRDDRARIHAVRLVPVGGYNKNDGVDPEDVLGYGWSGTEVTTGQYNPVLEWESPYYSNRRFQVARSLRRDNEGGHQHTYDGGNILRNHYVCAAGDDFQLFYMVGTPSITYS